MPRVLLVSEYFPPRNAIAAYRSGALAKFLPQFGWEPTVLTVQWDKSDGAYDPEFVPNMPVSLDVVRVPMIPPAHRPSIVKRKISSMFFAGRVPQYWWQPARRALETLLARKQFDAVWASSTPLADLSLGALAAARQEIPWVADVRDCFYLQPYQATFWGRWFCILAERRLVASSDSIVCVTENMRRYFATFAKKPVAVIPNGFDPDLAEMISPEPSPKFTITYTGRLYPGFRSPDTFLESLQLVRRYHPNNLSDFRVAFYGMSPAEFRESSRVSLEGLPVEIFPRIPHREAIRALKSSTVLLHICHPNERGVMTGKIFEYLLAGRPILAVPSDNDCGADLISRTQTGIALSDPQQVASTLMEWHSEWKKNGSVAFHPNRNEIQKYSRKDQAKELASILTQLVGTK